MPNVRELLHRAAPQPSDDWDVAEVARRGRSLRRRRRLAAGAAGGAAALVALAVAAPTLLDRGDTRVELGAADRGGENRPRAEEDPVPRPLAVPSREILWPFEGHELVVLAHDGLERDGLAALADEVAAHGAVTDAAVLEPAAVRDAIGEAQARRVSAGGAVVASLDAQPHERELRDAADAVLRSLAESADVPERVAATVVPDCPALARSAALVGRRAATERLDAVDCARPVHVIGANPQAEEPWAATSLGPVTPAPTEELEAAPSEPEMVLEGGVEGREAGEARIEESPRSGKRPVPGEPPARSHRRCVDVVTVRVRPAQGCGGDPDAIDGLTGTRWDREVAVIAGTAPEGTAAVRLDGREATVAADAGELPMFAGEVAVTGEPVVVRAVDADGAVLDERAVTPAHFAGNRGSRLDPSEPADPPLEVVWPFETATEAVVLTAPEVADAGIAALRQELAESDGVVDVATADDEAVRRTATRPQHDDVPPGGALRVTTEDRDAALALGTLAERHTVQTVATPTCAALGGTAAFAGLEHAEALLADAGCEEPVLVGADPGADEPWVAAAGVDGGRLCVADQRLRGGGGATCESPPPEGRVHLSLSQLGRAHLLTGRLRGVAGAVELETGEGVQTVEPVVVGGEWSVFAVTLPHPDEDVRVRALDADGRTIAEGEVAAPPPPNREPFDPPPEPPGSPSAGG